VLAIEKLRWVFNSASNENAALSADECWVFMDAIHILQCVQDGLLDIHTSAIKAGREQGYMKSLIAECLGDYPISPRSASQPTRAAAQEGRTDE
jgi:hypothetical protein